MKSFIITTVALLILSLSLPAYATFPGTTIAHWDLGQSNDQNDPGYQKVQELVREKKFQEALDILEKKHRENPKKGTPVILKAFILNETGKYLEAFKTLMEGENLQNRHPAIHFGLCQIHRNLGNGELSEQACAVATQQHFEAPETYYEIARTQALLGKMEAANKNLKKALQFDPDNATYYHDLGTHSDYLGQAKEAAEYFAQSVSLDPGNLASAYQLAYNYATHGEPEKAKDRIYKILDTRREDSNVDAAKSLLKVIDKKGMDKLPKNILHHQYHVDRSKNLYQKGQYGQSLLEIETASRLKPDDMKIKEILVGMYSILLRLEKGERALKELMDAAGNNTVIKARGYQELGDIRVLQGKLEAARAFYEQSKELGDPNQIAKSTLKEFPKEIPKPNPDLELKEIFILPTRALNYKGEVFAHYGMYDRANNLYAMVLRMDANHLPSILNTATAHYKTENYGRAISILERSLITHPNHEHILAHYLLLARAYVKNGATADGLKNLELAIRLNPSIKKIIQDDPVFDRIKQNADFKKIIK